MADKILAQEIIVSTMASTDYLNIVIGNDERRISVKDAAGIFNLGNKVFVGAATTAAVPNTDMPCFYAASEAGIYTNFGGLTVASNEIAFLVWDGTAWSKHTLRLLLHNDIGNRDVPDAHKASAIRFLTQSEDLSVHDKIIELESEDASQKSEYTAKFKDLKVENSFSAENKTLQNLADPVNDQDAANKRWTLLQASGNGSPKGVAYNATSPITNPSTGDWYWSADNGDYPNFGVTGATAGGRIIYDGSAWVFIASDQPYLPFPETDPATVATPASGYFVGTFNGRIWTKDTTGATSYQSKVSDFESQSQANGIELQLRDRAQADGGTHYPNTGAAALAKLVREDLYRKTSLILTAAAAKAGTGVGDGKLYSVKGNDFTVARNSKASRVDQDGYIRQVGIDEARIDYSDGKAKLLTEPQSTNKILYPFATENSYWNVAGANVELDPSTAGASIIGISASGTGWIDNGDGTFTSDGSNGTLIITGAFSTNKSYYRQLAVTGMTIGNILALSSGYSSEIPYLDITANGTFRDYIYTPPVLTEIGIKIYAQNGFDGTVDLNNSFIKEVQGFASPFKDAAGNVQLVARKLVEDTSTGTHKFARSFTALTDGGTYTFHASFKYAGRNVMVEITDGTNTVNVKYDLQNFTVLAGAGAIKELADGFAKISVTDTMPALTTGLTATVYTIDAAAANSYTGDGVSGIYIAGTVIEEQPAATSFPNDPADLEGSEVTRLGDVNNTQVTLNEDGGSFFIDFYYDGVGDFKVIQIQHPTSGDYIAIFLNNYGTDNSLLKLFLGGVANYVLTSIPKTIGKHKLVYTYEKTNNTWRGYLDGVLIGSYQSANQVIAETWLLRLYYAGSLYQNMQLNNMVFIQSTLTDEEAINLTK